MANEIKAVLDQYAEAVWNKDTEKFLALYDHNIHVYDAWQQWEYTGIQDFRTLPIAWFNDLGSDRVKVTFKDPTIQENDQLASIWTTVLYSAYDKADKPLRSISNRMTMILEKQADEWKIIHEHTYIPVDMETGQGVFKVTISEKKSL